MYILYSGENLPWLCLWECWAMLLRSYENICPGPKNDLNTWNYHQNHAVCNGHHDVCDPTWTLFPCWMKPMPCVGWHLWFWLLSSINYSNYCAGWHLWQVCGKGKGAGPCKEGRRPSSSQSLIIDPWTLNLDLWSLILDTWFLILDSWSLILDSNHWS